MNGITGYGYELKKFNPYESLASGLENQDLRSFAKKDCRFDI
jgi:hypothetical protein